ncbi:MAG: hypothetical protein OXF24_08290 [Hyphomicrobiales bacterium]|nr:hypothetical protein [Hyphomicrobiales bacterium]
MLEVYQKLYDTTASIPPSFLDDGEPTVLFVKMPAGQPQMLR